MRERKKRAKMEISRAKIRTTCDNRSSGMELTVAVSIYFECEAECSRREAEPSAMIGCLRKCPFRTKILEEFLAAGRE